MLFDRGIIEPSLVLDGTESFLTFLAKRQIEVSFHVAEQEDFPKDIGGDFDSPIAVAVEFIDGDVMVWEPWTLDEDT